MAFPTKLFDSVLLFNGKEPFFKIHFTFFIKWFIICKALQKYIKSYTQKHQSHGCWLSNPTLVGISKATLDKSLGLPQYECDF